MNKGLFVFGCGGMGVVDILNDGVIVGYERFVLKVVW